MSTAGQQEQARPVRQRVARLRPRSMAERSASGERFTLSPNGRRIAGWLVALLLVLGIAAVVRFVGTGGEAPPVGAGPSGSALAGDLPPITFGTAKDESTGQVAEASRTDTFVAGDTFAYSVAPGDEVPTEVYVEVERVGGEAPGVVQAPVEPQPVPDLRAIAFTVPADDLLAVFGPGDYVMRIYADPAGSPIAEGAFTLTSGPSGSAAPSASATPGS